MSIKPISFADKSEVQLVNDTKTYSNEWVSSIYLECEGFSGWVYNDEYLRDAYPLGPSPSHFIEGLPNLSELE